MHHPLDQEVAGLTPVRTHTKVAGLVPGWGTCGRQLVGVCLSVSQSLSPFLSLMSINISSDENLKNHPLATITVI